MNDEMPPPLPPVIPDYAPYNGKSNEEQPKPMVLVKTRSTLRPLCMGTIIACSILLFFVVMYTLMVHYGQLPY